MSCFCGIDIGGTLTKIVCFEPNSLKGSVRNIFEQKGLDDGLEINNATLNGHTGTLHFIRFPTCQLNENISLIKRLRLTTGLCCTGGGSFKFEEQLKSIDSPFNRIDELTSVIKGLHFINDIIPELECYYLSDHYGRRFTPLDNRRPYLVVNVGSGVSIIRVDSETNFTRVYGSGLGGGTFQGLCALLINCPSYDEAIDLASRGDNRHVDKLVRDIYGGDYVEWNLAGDLVASSFGSMIDADRRAAATREDIALATLSMICNNLGSISRLCAVNQKVDRVVFVGSFFRINEFALQQLSESLSFWSDNSLRALFLTHEGYFGAVGCLLHYTGH